MTTPDDQRLCKTCGQTWAWHVEHRPRHEFNNGDVSFRATFGQTTKERKDDKPVPRPVYPIDPVLRQALVDKGIVTPDDLDAARRKIEDMTRLFGGVPEKEETQ